MRLRFVNKRMKKLAAHNEELADRNWELKEAEERARSLLEAQGDLIVRRDSEGRITYANDAYCALAGTAARRAGRHASDARRRCSRAAPACCRTARGCTTSRS